MAVYVTKHLRAAQSALEAGRVAEARRILQRAVRENPEDYLAWLLLARTAASPQAALAYVRRAEMLQPDDAAVQAERTRLTAPATPAARNTVPAGRGRPPLRRSPLLWAVPLLFIALMLVGLTTWRSSAAGLPRSDSGQQPPLGQAIAGWISGGAPFEDVLVALEPTAVPTAVAQPTGTPPPTPTLAPTSTPTNTPVPTATAVPTVLAPESSSAIPPVVAPGERWIDVNLTTQTLVAYEGETPVYSTLISSGTWEFPTVVGQFRTYMKYESQTMNGYLLGYDYYLPDVPYVMYFYRDYAIHGTYWHNNFGTPMSHGCVNVSTADAGWLYNWAPTGTLVNVHH